MEKNRIKKIAILSALSTMLITGCNKQKTNETPSLEVQITTESTETISEETKVENETMEKIIDEYKQKVDSGVSYSDFSVVEISKPQFVWKSTDGNNEYIFNPNMTGKPVNYELEDCSYGAISVVKVNIHKDGSNWYVPIAALLNNNNNEISNIKVTFIDDDGFVHNPLEDYIYIDNPQSKDYYNIKYGTDFIESNLTSSNNKSLTLTKEND